MRTYDLTPLFRSTVGFDRLSAMLEAANRLDDGSNASGGYPPYNIEKTGSDQYGITLAVAGFTEADLDIQLQDQTLSIKGKIGGFNQGDKGGLRAIAGADKQEAEFLHRGIATRAFERRFQLADHIKVGQARLDHGLLKIDLVRELPEALKPRKIAISGVNTENAAGSDASSNGKIIENAAA